MGYTMTRLIPHIVVYTLSCIMYRFIPPLSDRILGYMIANLIFPLITRLLLGCNMVRYFALNRPYPGLQHGQTYNSSV
jgi:hypothetical protein